MKYYVAYGSNLSVAQMAFRCPDAHVIGKATLKDWKLVFRVHATIEPCKGSEVPVIVWAISERDEQRLDRYEGYPKYYRKQYLSVSVHTPGSKRFNARAMVYIMNAGRSIVPPSPEYFYTISEGYERFHLNRDILIKALNDSYEFQIPDDLKGAW